MNPNCNYTTTGGCSCTQPANPCPPSPPNPCPPPPPPAPCPPACPPGCMPVPTFPPLPPRPPVPPPPRAEEANVDCGCGCAAGMLGALELLCDPRLAPLVDYSQFAFFTPNFVLGTSLNCPDTATTAYDNLTGPLAGEFVSIKPCTCDDLEVSGQIYYPIPVCAADSCCAAGPAFTPSAVSVCSLTAVAFTVPASETQDETYTQLKSLLWQALHPGRPPLSNTAPVMKPTPCDCTESRLSGRRTVSVAAGPLLVANAAVLGSVGEVLVLANDADRRIYYVCQNSVSFSG